MLGELPLSENLPQDLPDIFRLEKSWKDVVVNPEELCERAQRKQDAIWELLTTERTYVQMLKQMHELYGNVKMMQEDGILQEIDAQRVFLNYSELYKHSIKFWKKAVLPMLRNSRKHGVALNPCLLKPGFDRIDQWWPSYADFLYRNPDCYAYVQECQKEHELFRKFVSVLRRSLEMLLEKLFTNLRVKWAESLDAMQRQRFLDVLMNPMQRLTRYSLLLKAVHKYSINRTERHILSEMISRVEAATHDVQETMNNRDDLEKLSRCIENYDGVDSKDFETIFFEKCNIRLSDPMPFFLNGPYFRRILLRSDLKFRDGKRGFEVDTHCILFTDLFLICEILDKCNERLKILKPPIHIAKLCFQALPEQFAETERWVQMFKDALREFNRLKYVYEQSYRTLYWNHKERKETESGMTLFSFDWTTGPLTPQTQVMGSPYGVKSGLLKLEGSCSADRVGRNSSNDGFVGTRSRTAAEIVRRRCATDWQILKKQLSPSELYRINKLSSADNLHQWIEDDSAGTHFSHQRLDPYMEVNLAPECPGQSKLPVDLHLTTSIPDQEDSPRILSRTASSSSSLSECAYVRNVKCPSHEKEVFRNCVEVTAEYAEGAEDEDANKLRCREEVRSETFVPNDYNEEEEFPKKSAKSIGSRFERKCHISDNTDAIRQVSVAVKRFSRIGYSSIYDKTKFATPVEVIDYHADIPEDDKPNATRFSQENRINPFIQHVCDEGEGCSRGVKSNGRRFGHRYYTSDGIYPMKQIPKVVKSFSRIGDRSMNQKEEYGNLVQATDHQAVPRDDQDANGICCRQEIGPEVRPESLCRQESNRRRFRRRYHTSDDIVKKRFPIYLKRFSWGDDCSVHQKEFANLTKTNGRRSRQKYHTSDSCQMVKQFHNVLTCFPWLGRCSMSEKDEFANSADVTVYHPDAEKSEDKDVNRRDS